MGGDGNLSFQDIRIAVTKQKIPSMYTPTVVDQLKEVMNGHDLSFPQWMMFTHWYRLFATYAVNDKKTNIKVLRMRDWLAMLHDRIVPNSLRIVIDGIFTDIPKKFYVPEPEIEDPGMKWEFKNKDLNDVDYLGTYKFIQINETLHKKNNLNSNDKVEKGIGFRP